MCQTISHLSPTSSQVLLLCVFSDILGVTVSRTFIIPDPILLDSVQFFDSMRAGAVCATVSRGM